MNETYEETESIEGEEESVGSISNLFDKSNEISINFDKINDSIGAKVNITGFSRFDIEFNGFKTIVKNAALPLPPSSYMGLVDMMVRLYYAGIIRSNQIGYDINTNKTFLNNRVNDANNRNIGTKRKDDQEVSGQFLSTS